MATSPKIPPWTSRLVVDYNQPPSEMVVLYEFLPGQERIKAWMNHLIAEAIEVKEAIGYTYNDQLKHWKKSINWDSVFEECEDALHFLLAAMMDIAHWIYGCETVEEMTELIFEKYKEKLLINHARQDQGY